MDASTKTGETVAEAYLTALYDQGVRHVFANGGTDFAPIIEALLQTSDAGRKVPNFVTVPHENVAMAMASGYYNVTGTPAAVMVHVTVGTANALCGIMNSYRGRIPILLAAGRTPLTETGHAGSRDIGIHWSQETFDQASMLRDYVKWDYELRAGQPVGTIVGRALDIAMTEPKGPVYMTLPREVLGGENLDAGPKRRDRALGATPPAPSLDAVERAADMIAAATRPLIIGGYADGSAEAFFALADLAETHAIAVAQVMGGSTLPSSSPMNLGMVSPELFDWADCIIVLEAPVPWIPKTAGPKPDAKQIHIGSDPLFSTYPHRGYEMDLSITGTAEQTVPLLNEILATKLGKKSDAVEKRRAEILDMRQKTEDARAKILSQAQSSTPIHPGWIAKCINDVKSADTIIANELGVPGAFLDLDQPGCLLGGGGSAGGLGSSIGAGLGAKLGAPDRQVITTVGDGSYMFNVPTACHFVARAENLPTLTIINNNSEWYAVRRATTVMYPEGRAAKSNTLPVVNLAPSPNYEKIVESVDGYGEKVEDPAKLPAAMERAMQAVEDGNPAVLNVVTQAGGR
ncbi:MAG: thiamine pyrophosphate-requiring protein [Rhodospirillaceae bacterium]|jgi:acetolactate synthase I/II/III large subunit|nr:thiamine pyrophosphate-requiring protein [Rhodospirillaceae bacterium]MBT3886049.1 thiamine pyrophosphate-requiring protein [Rhodospirillaceae bacterium]MBT4117028.1 thiamine pyrophosphate-requiring protein [Rhodospirillaceae bacterium]MBT4672253.1 thiamine pyrophosphate-requiring protein [Rhodospirillaceae bacterium]MBT4749194.1 thiamine pyrophosphate-requiring protein [Rhodospirillaceae bacterium]